MNRIVNRKSLGTFLRLLVFIFFILAAVSIFTDIVVAEHGTADIAAAFFISALLIIQYIAVRARKKAQPARCDQCINSVTGINK